MQIDGPSLVTGVDDRILAALEQIYARLAAAAPAVKLLLAAYFGPLGEALPRVLKLPVQAVHLGLTGRGLLERTLVAVMGEFGRSPKVNAAAGRDHWNFCYSLLLAGGGIKPGMVHGSSDKIGAYPSSNPVTPADVVATLYHCLGVPTDYELRDRQSRPFQVVPWGTPIREALS
jgi:hypothetical protein